jgi:histidinol phosphatase-like enzyme
MDYSYAIVIISNQGGLSSGNKDKRMKDFKEKIASIAAAVGDYAG